MLEIQSRAKATIARRTIEQTKPIPLQWHSGSSGQVLTYTSSAGTYNWANTGQYNTAIGYKAGYQVGTGISQSVPNNSIQFNSNAGKPVLIITKDGDVEWHGKPSEAANALVKTFQFAVEDQKGVTKAARRRYYYKACKNILNKAETMDQKDFIDFLQKQVYNRERKVIVDSLKGEQ